MNRQQINVYRSTSKNLSLSGFATAAWPLGPVIGLFLASACTSLPEDLSGTCHYSELSKIKLLTSYNVVSSSLMKEAKGCQRMIPISLERGGLDFW